MVCFSVVLGFALQQSKLGQNDSVSTVKQKVFLKTIILGLFVYAKNVINTIWRLTLRHVLTESLELKFMCENIAFVLNNKY